MVKKCTAMLLVLLLVVSMIPTVFAAKAGSTVSVSFPIGTEGYAVSGTISISDPNGIIADVSSTTVWAGNWENGELTSFAPSINVTLKSSAKAGQSATLTLNYKLTTDDMGQSSVTGSVSKTVTIDQNGGGTKPSKKVDYSELERQIAIANGLNKAEYTKESWAVLEEALANGLDALSSTDQAVVDAAAKALADAIAALVKMDYSALEEALKAVQDFIDSEELADLWIRLVQAFLKGKELLTSGDQEACNATASEIMSILEELKARLEELRTPEVVTEIVEVEVMPEGEFCNIPLHKLWPILFFVSLILNVGLIVVIVVIVSKKKNNAKDKTPLVDYDIGDDA